MENTSIWMIPVVLGLIAVEFLFDHYHGTTRYSLRDTLTSFAISIMALIVTFLCRGASFAFLYLMYDSALMDLSMRWYNWLIAFVLIDFLGYWLHWLGHHSTFFWLVHAPHHSSEKYNLSTAIRLPVLSGCFRFVLWAPLCLTGFHPAMVVALEASMYFYQFFLHTENIGRLGWLENVLNTPSHHRVHHATNEQYLDKNFGAVLIIWDRLFGTFQAEQAKPRYGIVGRTASLNPFKIVFQDWYYLLASLGNAPSFSDMMRLLFGRPVKLDLYKKKLAPYHRIAIGIVTFASLMAMAFFVT